MRELPGTTPLVVVDYLQKVKSSHPDEESSTTEIVEGLKDLAIDIGAPVLAIAAADKDALRSGKRMRANDLRGSSALAYEADVVLVLNNKFDIVARHHLTYDLGNAERFREYAVLTLEKNRFGRDGVDAAVPHPLRPGPLRARGRGGQGAADRRAGLPATDLPGDPPAVAHIPGCSVTSAGRGRLDRRRRCRSRSRCPRWSWWSACRRPRAGISMVCVNLRGRSSASTHISITSSSGSMSAIAAGNSIALRYCVGSRVIR